jgi:hypothetical protein
VDAKAEVGITEDRMRELAGELIKEAVAFSDKGITSAYEDAPAFDKLPDYIVARAIEEAIR